MEALEELYHIYGRELFEYLCWLTKDPHRAEDILQECFIRAMKGILKFQGRSSLKTWLFSIARNCYIDDLRKRREIKSLEDIPEIAGAFDLEGKVLNRELKDSITLALNTLDDRSRKVVTLRSQGFSFSEIGVQTGISEGSARVLNHRAMKKLKEFFEKEGLI